MSARERRWAVIALDGRHTWLGRATDPTEAEIAEAAAALAAGGETAWLAVVEGIYYSTDTLSAVEVRLLAGRGEWRDALAAFLARRATALGGLPR